MLSLVTAYLGHEITSFLDPVLVFLLQVQAHREVLPDTARKSLPILLVAEPFLLCPKIFRLLRFKIIFSGVYLLNDFNDFFFGLSTFYAQFCVPLPITCKCFDFYKLKFSW